MTRQDQATQDRFHPETSRGHYLLEVLGILSFVLLLLLIGVDFYQGCSTSTTCGLRRAWLSWLTWPLTSSPGSCTSSPTTLDRTRFFERVEPLIRRSLPGTDPRLRSEG